MSRYVRIYGKASTRHLRAAVSPLLSLEVAAPENKEHGNCHPIRKKVRTRWRSPPHKQFLQGFSSPFVQLAEHLTALRAWCKQCLPGR